jgi:G:T/U-mismatch repair DNA glycosylase
VSVSENEATISQRTRVELSLTIAIVGGICAIMFVGWRFDKRLTRIEDALAGDGSEQWTLPQESESAFRLKAANPMLSVPDPRSPGQFIPGGQLP